MGNGRLPAAEAAKSIEDSGIGPGRNGFSEGRIGTPFRRDEFAANPSTYPDTGPQTTTCRTGGHSEILSVESEFEGENGRWRDRRGRSAFSWTMPSGFLRRHT